MDNNTLSEEFLEKWYHLLGEVDVADVPIEYISRLELFFNDGRNPAYIDITQLLKEQSPRTLERTINRELDSIDSILDRVDFHLNVEKVAEIVDESTNSLLKNL